LRSETWDKISYQEAVNRLERQVKAGNIVEIDGRYSSWEMLRADREYMLSAGTNLKGWQKNDYKAIKETVVNKKLSRNKMVKDSYQTYKLKQ